ncbi:MAG: serine/threonine protein kinase [Akkermansiaceae bacterium]|jgi:serine/threonine protein kinase|nr:serine/threonine protein kinase [Akkermansiaceae bacterium]MDP4646118.1 serine/threonine protein kinase [Akkermansiaceae bacterium]MDP4720917.1 serine/threonine protein kinase [Akkermansiaceae bacterium]MDP4780724.1 serine/threonine protein kinase [Akkermansiaceae bacterium]MDP4845670.1 serine/threonine protein kinase [Akkermansiaceae bacterium]
MSDHSHPAAFEAPELEEVALLFPNYSIIRLIACGGMGAVYEATQTSLDRQVAIKILPREFSSDQAFREGFESEAKAMAKLNHPNLIGVYDFGEAGGMLYIVMEYVAGNSLYASSYGKRIEPSVAISVIERVCHGLNDAHAHGILHRDIKPSNILLDQSVTPKIGDFGLARALEREIQEGEQIFGTPGYTAPEVLKPPFTIDQRADIFSVGVMLHELLTGQLPDADPRPASKICGCSFRLDAIILKATQKDPRMRFASCQEMADALARVAAIKATGGLVSAATTGSSALPRPGKYVPPKPVKSSSGLGVVVFILVIAAAIAFFVLNRDTGDNETPEETPSEENAAVTPTPPPVAESTADREPSERTFDAQAAIERIRREVNRNFAAEQKAFEEERRRNAEEYGQKLTALAKSLDAGDQAAAEDSISKYLSRIANKGHWVPEKLPSELSDIPGIEEILASCRESQRKANLSIAQKMRECKSYYLLELEHEITKNKGKASPSDLAILQDELDRVNENDAYFKKNIME